MQLKYLVDDYVLFSKRAELRIVRYEQCLDKRCAIAGFECRLYLEASWGYVCTVGFICIM